MKIITVGGATQDIFFSYEGADIMTIDKKGALQSFMLFESGEKVEIDSIQYYTGGGATNTAASFKRLGLEAGCFCSIGNDAAGQAITTALTNEGVDIGLVTTNPHHSTGISAIINTIRGDRTIFAYRGANAHLIPNPKLFDELKTTQLLYITSLSKQSATMLPELVLVARKNKVSVAINPGTSQLAHDTQNLKKSLTHIDTLILNSSEARTFMTALVQTDEEYKSSLKSSTEKHPCSLNEPNRDPYLMQYPLCNKSYYFSMPKFFKEVLKMGPSIVVVTNGANGVYVATPSAVYFHPSIKVNVMSAVGAGDAFGSCFTASLQLGYSIPDALRNGVVNSASVLEHIGAKEGLLTHENLKARVRAIPSTLLQSMPL